MPPANQASERRSGDNAQIVLGILEAIDSGQKVTQRAVADELGIALGLVNAYLKRCMHKGWVKVSNAPARRYAYYLTPQGFAEKSKLTASYLVHSFSFFRTARADCENVLAQAIARKMKRVALVGAGELAEIMTLCAVDRPIEIAAIVDTRKVSPYAGIPIVASFDKLPPVDGLIVSDLADPLGSFNAAVAARGADKVLAPALLRTKPSQRKPRRGARERIAS